MTLIGDNKKVFETLKNHEGGKLHPKTINNCISKISSEVKEARFEEKMIENLKSVTKSML